MIATSTLGLSLVRVIEEFKTIPLDYLATQFNRSPQEIREELQPLVDKEVVKVDDQKGEVSVR